MSLHRRSLTVVLTTLIAAAALPGQISASSASTASAAPTVEQPAARRAPSMAVGVLVKTTTPTASTGLVRAAEAALPRGADLEKVRKSAMGGRTSLIPASRRMTGREAEAVAAKLRERSDVVWASPNYVMTPSAESPVPANDPYFTSDRNRTVWDERSRTDSRVKLIMGASNTFGAGGFSSRVPYLWRATKGEDQVVAVLDTGITVHPDLPGWNGSEASGRILPGYDFVSRYEWDDSDVEDTGRDGDGWDANPQDKGDWTPADYCYEDAPAENSSWHGTHVTGILAAQKDNNQGLVGVAPSVNVLPVRVLGMCGGTVEDIATGIKWAAGVAVGPSVEGVPTPVNPNPADVINLSLGGYAVDVFGDFGTCSEGAPAYVEAIGAARAEGAVVVAAAGNEGWHLGSHPVLPATCSGVIAVGATSEYGDRAGYGTSSSTKAVYSNYGGAVDISAPGGDPFWDGRGIKSASNTGLRSIGSATYKDEIGTSMATPVVSAGAALIKSLGNFTPDQTEAALEAAVQPFPKGTSAPFKPCSTSLCGKGIISLNKVPAPLTDPSISGLVALNEPLTAAPGTWNSSPTSFTYQWLRDGEPITGATGSTYTVKSADIGAKLAVRVAPNSSAFAPIKSTSPETVAVPVGPAVTLTGLPTSTRYGATTAPATVTVTGVGAGQAVQLRRGTTVLASGATNAEGVASIAVPGAAWVAGANAVRATYLGDGSNAPAASASTSVSVAKASSTITYTLPTSVRYTSRATIAVTVKVAGITGPSGTVTIYSDSKKVASMNLPASFKGKRSLLLPRLSKGRHSIKAVYSGNSNTSNRTSLSRFITSY